MMKAVEGHVIEVRSANDYINLYHVFERLQEKHRRFQKLALARTRLGRLGGS